MRPPPNGRRLSDSQIFPLYSSSIEPWKMPCARSRARRLALDANVSPLIFRLLKALPSGNYRNLLMRMVRSRLSSKELLESHILAHALNDRDEARCVNAIDGRRCGTLAGSSPGWSPPLPLLRLHAGIGDHLADDRQFAADGLVHLRWRAGDQFPAQGRDEPFGEGRLPEDVAHLPADPLDQSGRRARRCCEAKPDEGLD